METKQENGAYLTLERNQILERVFKDQFNRPKFISEYCYGKEDWQDTCHKYWAIVSDIEECWRICDCSKLDSYFEGKADYIKGWGMTSESHSYSLGNGVTFDRSRGDYQGNFYTIYRETSKGFPESVISITDQ